MNEEAALIDLTEKERGIVIALAKQLSGVRIEDAHRLLFATKKYLDQKTVIS